MSRFLVGKKIYLRPLQPSDAEGSYPDWLNDQEVCRNNGHGIYPYTRQQAMEYIEWANKTRENLILAIVTISGCVHIGNIALQRIDPIHRTADLTILIGEKWRYWGKGYGKEACRLIIEHGFSALNLSRISCGTMACNVAMRKLALSLGFKEEGIRRQALYKNGEYVDVMEFGLIKNEWEANHGR